MSRHLHLGFCSVWRRRQCCSSLRRGRASRASTGSFSRPTFDWCSATAGSFAAAGLRPGPLLPRSAVLPPGGFAQARSCRKGPSAHSLPGFVVRGRAFDRPLLVRSRRGGSCVLLISYTMLIMINGEGNNRKHSSLEMYFTTDSSQQEK